MLRLAVIFLLLANGLYFGWAQGYFSLLGFAPAIQREPARVAGQIKPQAVSVITSAEQPSIEQSPTPPAPFAPVAVVTKTSQCLQSGLIGEAVALAVRRVAAPLPSNAWSLDAMVIAPRWIVYMGKYPTVDALDKKKTELTQLAVDFEPLRSKSLEPGIALGGFDTQALANEALANLNKRGVRTARVVQESVQQRGQVLRLPVVDEALYSQLAPVRAALGSVALQTCPG